MIPRVASRKRDHGSEHTSGEEVQESIYPNYHEENITDGSEFVDDAIRMKDQPLGETNEKENE